MTWPWSMGDRIQSEPDASHRKRRGFRAPKWLLALGGAGVALILLEIGLRVVLGYHLDFGVSYRVYDPLVGHLHRPNLNIRVPFAEHPQGYFDLVINNQGLREEQDTSYANPTGIFRAVVLGDSHTDGAVFDSETYPNQLESILISQGLQVEVLNGGVAAYEPLQELFWFHYYGRQYNPDLVILGLYVGNDLIGMKGFENVRIDDRGQVFVDGLAKTPRPQPFDERLTELANQSYLYSIFRWNVFPKLAGEEQTPEAQAFRVCRGCYFQSLDQANQVADEKIEFEVALARLENILTVLNGQAKAAGAQLVILLIPTKRQVEGPSSDAERIQESAALLELPSKLWDFDTTVLDALLALGERNGLAIFNPLPELQAVYEEDGQPLYYFTDWHLNPSGHRALADALSRYLWENGYLASPAP